MPSPQTLKSDYLALTVEIYPDSERLQKYVDHINTFPEGSAARLEQEGIFFNLLATYVSGLADHVRASEELTLHDIEQK